MPRGPLPSPNARRRNAPTIPTRELPSGGRSGKAPECPYDLAERGRRWWDWAWSLPQATAWDSGALYFAARRAQLEDDVAVLESGGEMGLGLADALGLAEEDETVEQVEWIVRKLTSMAGGKNPLIREMRELDNRLGLNPKAMVDLRWSIKEAEAEKGRAEKQTSGGRRLRAVG